VIGHEELTGDQFEGLDEKGAHCEWLSTATVVWAEWNGDNGAEECSPEAIDGS
jgi:hypothetical protein